MNRRMIVYLLGRVLFIEGALMLLPTLCALIYRERCGLWFVAVGALCCLIGLAVSRREPADPVFYLKEGCIVTALSWLLISIFGALPFVLSGAIPSFTDALFETVSGFTTTGASILPAVEPLPRCMLFWRSFTHWVGGMGVLVFLLAIMPIHGGGSHFNLMRAESPGPSVGKLVPKVLSTARILYYIYIVLTAINVALLFIGGMPLFDALTTAFGTAGTGGFGIKNDSLASYGIHLQWITGIFMMLFGINFNAYFLVLYDSPKKAFKMEEVRAYLAVILVSTVLITLNILPQVSDVFPALTQAFFQVSSIITTTGFSTVDFNAWPSFSKAILVVLVFCGACAGSTGGGIKVSRLLLLAKASLNEFRAYLHPRSVRTIKLDGRAVERETLHSVYVFCAVYFFVFCGSTLLVLLEGVDLVTGFTAVAATINNIGPGLNAVGPAANYGQLTILTKYVLIFDMLAGRLELFPLLLLLHPSLLKELLRPGASASGKGGESYAGR